MPIFHDDFRPASPRPTQVDRRPASPYNDQAEGARNEASLATAPPTSPSMAEVDRGAAATASDERQSILDRASLIERIKRQTPNWQPQPNVGDLFNFSMPILPSSRQQSKSPMRRLGPDSAAPASASQELPQENNLVAGMAIERPRSALHSGDFRQEKDAAHYSTASENSTLSTSPVAPWHHSFPASALPRPRAADNIAANARPQDFPFTESWHERRTLRSRATSQSSLSSNFVLLPPTSPLVQQSNNPDLDFSPRPRSRQISRSPDRDNRRHTFSPQSLQTFHYSHNRLPTHSTRPLPSIKREGTYPYQAHQPRRSLASSLGHCNSTPQTPLLQPRRPSISSESPPLQHAPMVGSYEESILRGRMSTTPSRPLNFVAQIGVLGKGQCKPQLRCPPHVTLPFPAVFYSYNSGNGRIADSQPSPYVGLIDLENGLKPGDEASETRKKRRHHTHHAHATDPSPSEPPKTTHRLREKAHRRSTSPRRSPPGGSYRIPPHGQLQIVIKNPNKTAVKLFLVPYDISDMEPGTKTFIRQRSYSAAGPVIDMPLSSRQNLGTDRPEASLWGGEGDVSERPVLRYLVHLNVCCTGRGRYWLYKSVRVVFANRVPDGKEKLRNEIQLPEPKYSAQEPGAAPATTGSSMLETAEMARRMRSAGVSGRQHLDAMAFGAQVDGANDGFATAGSPLSGRGGLHAPRTAGAADSNGLRPGFSPLLPPPFQHQHQLAALPPLTPIPFALSSRLSTLDSGPGSRDRMDVDGGVGSGSGSGSGSGFDAEVETAMAWEKRARSSFSIKNPTSPRAAGLLAQRLRGLGVGREAEVEAAAEAEAGSSGAGGSGEVGEQTQEGM
ncbi:hypothetical protein K490DRAFT_72393 [Saccharata proteae CBS 121410]|uniref:Atos-like conserved domain-containing protein n=1 Tax=Saccharata proteae CBS 121410 TaxID=1314787 RepID=A0A6A5YDY3_9PEZI|nr:hypothetical protein K490DRAFT_72393 [Saccharata proteae CBS 121410]